MRREHNVLFSELGLPPETIESVYRLLLMASRDHQAALKAEVPLDVTPRTVAILGGEGGMGKMLTRLFGDLGHAVIAADTRNGLSNIDAAKAAGMVEMFDPRAPYLAQLARLIDLDRLKAAGLKAKMLLQVHDELVLECPEPEAEAVSATVRSAMETCFPLRVPLEVSVGRGRTWFDVH